MRTVYLTIWSVVGMLIMFHFISISFQASKLAETITTELEILQAQLR